MSSILKRAKNERMHMDIYKVKLPKHISHAEALLSEDCAAVAILQQYDITVLEHFSYH